MDLQTFISDPDRRKALALAVPTSEPYLWQLATGWRGRKPSTELAKAIARCSADIHPPGVSLATLRPDIWGGDVLGNTERVACGG